MATEPTQPHTTATAPGQPQKYIRTFAGDMAVAQKGGIPDLAPLASHGSAGTVPTAVSGAPKDVPVLSPTAPAPVESAKTPAKILSEMEVIAAKTAPKWADETREETLARLRGFPAPPVEAPPIAPPPVPTGPIHEDIVVSRSSAFPSAWPADNPAQTPAPVEAPAPVHTYTDDFSGKIKNERASTATILAAQQDAAPISAQPPRESSVKKVVYVMLGILLLGFGIGGVYYAYMSYLAANAPVVVAPSLQAPIFFDEQEEVPAGGPTLLPAVIASVGKPLSNGMVRLLYTTNATTTRRSIFSALSIAAPDVVFRNIQGARSMTGIVNVGGNQSPFFILGVSSYKETFAGMLAWERTMTTNLTTLFPPYPTLEAVPPTTATTTPKVATTTKSTTAAKAPAAPKVTKASTTPATVPTFVPGFRDEVVANHDVRVYRDAFGQSVVLYGYWDQATLIIARDPNAFTEIGTRLANSRTQP